MPDEFNLLQKLYHMVDRSIGKMYLQLLKRGRSLSLPPRLQKMIQLVIILATEFLFLSICLFLDSRSSTTHLLGHLCETRWA